MHSTASDGSLSPAELARLASERHLKAIGICDHDTVSGVLSLWPPGVSPDFSTPLLVDGVEIVPGIEMNCEWGGRELHIVGYYVSMSKGPFMELIEDLRASRQERAALMVKKLDALGFHLELTRVLEIAGGDSVGRPHIAEAMVEKGYVSSVKQAFERYLGIGRPAYVGRRRLRPLDAVRAIADAGGAAVWAHPGTSRSLALIENIVERGLVGIEAYHPEHDRGMVEECLRLASTFNLIVTGGSDFHGMSSDEGGDLGSTAVPYAVVSSLKARSSQSIGRKDVRP